MTFAARLKQARTERGWSMAELGRQAGYDNPRQSIYKLELGESEPRRDTIERLAKALNVSPAWLAFGE